MVMTPSLIRGHSKPLAGQMQRLRTLSISGSFSIQGPIGSFIGVCVHYDTKATDIMKKTGEYIARFLDYLMLDDQAAFAAVPKRL